MKRLLLLVILLVFPLGVLAQDVPTPPEAEIALADLNAQLGTSLTLDTVDNWTWEEQDFGDTSLGCPHPDQMYAQVLTRGYIFTFTQDSVIYDYRAPSNSGTAFLCTITIVEATPEATPETAPISGIVISAANAVGITELAQVTGNFATTMDYSPTGNTIAVAGLTVPDPAQNTAPALLVYNAHDLTEAPQALLPSAEPLLSLTYVQTSVGASLVTGGMQGAIALFPVEPQGFDILFMQTQRFQNVFDVAVTTDGSLIASANSSASSASNVGRGVYLWNASTGEQVALIETEAASQSVAFSPDDQVLAVGDVEGTIHLWDVSDPTAPVQIASLQGHSATVTDLEYSPDGTLLASASLDTTTRLWNVAGEPESYGEVALLQTDSNGSVMALDFSPDGSLLAAAGSALSDADPRASVLVWDVSAATTTDAVPLPLTALEGHESLIGAVAFSPDGTRIASVGLDRTLRLWGLPHSVDAVG